MNRTKKIVLASFATIFLFLVGYFFLPKTRTQCGSALPISCQVCRCSMGIPYASHSIGGSGIQCFMGKLFDCKTIDSSETRPDQRNDNQNNQQPSEAEKYCLNNGGKVGETMECSKKVATCILKGGTINETVCPLDQYFRRECEEGVIVEWGEACREEVTCAKEGKAIGAAGLPSSCCSGLKPVGGWPGGYSGDCTLPPPPTGLNICAQCGNGKCDVDNGENKCNCREDCQS